jgi:hypothetical protein
MVTLVKIALMITITVTLVWMTTIYFDRNPEYADGGTASVPSVPPPLPPEPPSPEPEPEPSPLPSPLPLPLPFPFCVDLPLPLGGGGLVSDGIAPAAFGALLSLLPGAEGTTEAGLLIGTEALSDAALLANAAMLGTTELLAGDIEAAEGGETAGVGVFTADGELADDAGLLTDAKLLADNELLTDAGLLTEELELSACVELVGETTVGVVELAGEEFVPGELLTEELPDEAGVDTLGAVELAGRLTVGLLDEDSATASTVGDAVLDGVDEGAGEDDVGTLELGFVDTGGLELLELEGTAGVLELENEVTLKVRLDEGSELEGLVVGGTATGGVEMLGGTVVVMFVVFNTGEAGKINSPENELIVSRALNPLTPKNEGEATEVNVQLTPGSQDGSPEQQPGGGEPPLLKVKAVQPG